MDDVERIRIQETASMVMEMPPEWREWLKATLLELLTDIKADQMLTEALPGYEPLDPAAWRPSTLPPDCATWEEYEARLAAAI